MKESNLTKIVLAAVFTIFIIGNVIADPINDITINDDGRSNGSGWYGPHEDDEVEPGMQISQKWDLEKFLLKDKSLSMVGGYNFKDGQSNIYNPNGYKYSSGDIFIDVQGSENQWDYAIVMDFTQQNDDGSYNYKLYSLDGSETYDPGKLPQNGNQLSEPWRLASGGTLEEGLGGSFTFRELTNEEAIALGLNPNEKHYTVEGFDLAFLDGEGEFLVHFTMECGNDNMIGKSSISLPEPGTFSLLFMGSMCMIGFWAFRRRREE